MAMGNVLIRSLYEPEDYAVARRQWFV